MTLEKARAALLAEILGGGAEPANQASSSENQLDKSALQQIVSGCFVKLQQLRLLQCDACKKSFHKRSRLMIHYFDTHVNKDLEESDIPTGAGVDIEEFAPDVKNFDRTNSNSLKLHPCNICDESFAFKVDMLIHQLKHTGKEPEECEICQKLFINKSSLNYHITNSHVAEMHTCDVCDKQFHALIYLKRHKKRHSDIKPYSCEFCKKTFADKLSMKRHRRTHTGETPYICACGRQFPYYSGLKYHRCIYRTTQQSEKELECDYCNKKYRSRASLLIHIKWHMDDQIYSCDRCKLKFNTSWSLKRHHAKHTGDLPYPCTVCDSKFAMNYQLKRHMLTHTKEKVYSCEICDKRFATRYNTNVHLKVHTKTYKCTVCKKSFNRKSKLNRHVKLCEPKQHSVKVLKIKRSKAKKSSVVCTSDSSCSYE